MSIELVKHASPLGSKDANGKEVQTSIKKVLFRSPPLGDKGGQGNTMINLKMKKMKKQILFLTMFTLALIFAGTNSAFGQIVAAPGSEPKTFSCPNNSAINPIAGVPYNYTAFFSPGGGIAFIYATTSTSIVTGTARTANIEAKGGDYVSAGTQYAANIDLTSGATPTTSITWNSSGLSKVTTALPLLVVVEYEALTANCANNVKVWNIIPKNTFTVDIRSMESDRTGPAAYGTKTTQCADDVETATFNTTTTSMNMDYGDQTLYFEVIAANFTGSFTPSFQLTGLLGDEQTAEIFLGATAEGATTSLGTAAEGATVAGPKVTTALTNTSAGVSIYVKVVIQNNKYENTAGQTIQLAVDAINSASEKDVLETDCSENADFADAASQDITARPDLAPVAPEPFVPEN